MLLRRAYEGVLYDIARSILMCSIWYCDEHIKVCYIIMGAYSGVLYIIMEAYSGVLLCI